MADDCLARVAARATGTSVEEFWECLGRTRGPTLGDFYRYLVDRGYLCGLRLIEPQPIDNVIPCGPFDYRSADALVVVKALFGRQHALFFHKDSNKLLDCTAQGEKVVALGESPILEWVPITKLPT